MNSTLNWEEKVTKYKMCAGSCSYEIRIDLGDSNDDFLKIITTNTSTTDGEKMHYDKIGWLPQILQRDYKYLFECCYPKEFPIGPIFYYLYEAKVNRHMQLRDELNVWEIMFNDKWCLKLLLANDFIKSFSKDKKGTELLSKIKNNIDNNNLKESIFNNVYDPPDKWVRIIKFSDDSLAKLLLLDGCAVLHFIHNYVHSEVTKFGIDNLQATLIQEDLFLLQNQIPFKVIELILDSIEEDLATKLKVDILNFLHINDLMTKEPVRQEYSKEQCDKILIHNKHHNAHLLQLLYFFIKSGESIITPPNKSFTKLTITTFKYLLVCCLMPLICILLPFSDSFKLRFKPYSDAFMCRIRNLFGQKTNIVNNKRYFRNVRELKSAGIDFKPSVQSIPFGKSISFKNGKFNIKGHLKLPQITVDKYTKSKLMNLVAYEMCLPPNEYPIASFVKFMDFLIDGEEDVKELRKSSVLRHRLSCDADVAKLFNDMGSKCYDHSKDFYCNVKENIEIHCKRCHASWIAQLSERYFSSPWPIIAVSAATIGLLMTGAQTWYAMNPKS
ncbi:hypothetical protein CsatB_002524 [Cannabis sativa]